MFQICDVNVPGDLDQRLKQRGYRLQEPCTCLAKRIDPAAGACVDVNVELAQAPTEDWLTVYLAGITITRRSLAPKILARVPSPRAFLLFRDQGEPLASALCVVAEGVAIAECVATRADRRRTGAGSRIMGALEAWARRRGASIAALQAVAGNAAAQGLYAKLAYTRVGGYHYRVLDP
jgi:GNAT superfamily N-acetyltransferase